MFLGRVCLSARPLELARAVDETCPYKIKNNVKTNTSTQRMIKKLSKKNIQHI